MGAIQTAMSHWEYIAPVLTAPNTEEDYDQLVENLDLVLDSGGADENHPLAGLADRMGDLISDYENKNHRITTSATDALKFIMEDHQLKQSELPEIGSQGVVSEVLSGKRSLNVDQIRRLSQRFNVSAAVFI
uniref:Transcriptional regulator n=1 Tax=uncultured Thiotrichaceae bacterium TaxID=298394 RepID=A0A6S6TCK0_9GAMM|nr:MAG: Transcriptional regulator [uncultured Thiotrichaceae bacterium]